MSRCITLSVALLCLALPWSVLAATPGSGPNPEAAVVLPPTVADGFAPPPATPSQPPAPAMAETPASLDNAPNVQAVLDKLQLRLSPAQRQFLNDNKFLLVPQAATAFAGRVDLASPTSPEPYDAMLGLFDQVCGDPDPLERRPENVRLVTSDIVLHAMGKYFENVLEYLEDTELAPLAARFVAGLRDQALTRRQGASGPLAERLDTVAAQLTVPLIALEVGGATKPKPAARPGEPQGAPKPAPAAKDDEKAALARLKAGQKDFSPQTLERIAAELKLVYAASDVTTSPLFGGYDPEIGLKTDYTQYAPRGHYAKTARLRGYFRAMIALGRNAWPLGRPDGLSDALLVMLLTAGPGRDGKPLLASWQRLMDVTGFFAGLPDDIAYGELRDHVATVLGRPRLTPAEAVDPAVRDKLLAARGSLRQPRILSDILASPAVPGLTKEQLLARTLNFRLFGQRFSPDAWVLARLTAGQEKTELRLPSMPTALFVPAALGNATARELAAAYLAKPNPGFSPAEVAAFLARLDATAASLAKLSPADWEASLASGWLHVLSTLGAAYGPGWPAYMQAKPFAIKQIETILGSYTELKHATVLYAKQNYAEFGGGGEDGTPPPVPKGFVEPNPAFWNAMIRLCDTAMAGFARHKLLPMELEEGGRLRTFRDDLAFFGALADKELANTPIGEEQYERLRLTNLSYLAAPFGDVILDADQCRSALVTDLHTDAVSGCVLYEGTGEPYVMLVLVGNEASPRLVVGTAFNHYEFTRPLAGPRLTDEAWRAGVYANPPRLPEKNDWYDVLRVQ